AVADLEGNILAGLEAGDNRPVACLVGDGLPVDGDDDSALIQADLIGEGAWMHGGDDDAALDAELGGEAGGDGIDLDAELGFGRVGVGGGGGGVGLWPRVCG